MSEFVVGGIVGDEEAFFVTSGGSTNDAGASDGSLDDGDEGAELTFEDGVEIVGSSCCDETITVGEFRKDTNIVGVFVLDAICHEIIISIVVVDNKRINNLTHI